MGILLATVLNEASFILGIGEQLQSLNNKKGIHIWDYSLNLFERASSCKNIVNSEPVGDKVLQQ